MCNYEFTCTVVISFVLISDKLSWNKYSGKACPKICFPIITTNFDNSMLLCVCLYCSVHVYIALVFMYAHVYEAAHVCVCPFLMA